jgi:hypothetical protein
MYQFNIKELTIVSRAKSADGPAAGKPCRAPSKIFCQTGAGEC